MHRFHIDLPALWQTPELPQALLDTLSAKAREAGATVNLGPKTGTGTANTPLGGVELSYELEPTKLWISVDKKPMLVPDHMVEAGVRRGADKLFEEYPGGLEQFSAQA